MVGRIILPQNVDALIFQICGYVILYGKRAFAGVIKLRDIIWIIQVGPVP